MNHLAHFFLSFKNEDWIVGNWLADFVPQKAVADFAPEVQNGIFLHRRIDSFADEHNGIKNSVNRLRPFAGRYAKVLIDIFNDHSLSKNWMLFSPDESLRDFSDSIYEVLKKRQNELPENLAERTKSMITANWLMGYGSREGMENVLERFEKRMAAHPFYQKQRVDWRAALDCFLGEQDFFDQNFVLFFGEMIEKMRAFEPSKIA